MDIKNKKVRLISFILAILILATSIIPILPTLVFAEGDGSGEGDYVGGSGSVEIKDPWSRRRDLYGYRLTLYHAPTEEDLINGNGKKIGKSVLYKAGGGDYNLSGVFTSGLSVYEYMNDAAGVKFYDIKDGKQYKGIEGGAEKAKIFFAGSSEVRDVVGKSSYLKGKMPAIESANTWTDEYIVETFGTDNFKGLKELIKDTGLETFKVDDISSEFSPEVVEQLKDIEKRAETAYKKWRETNTIIIPSVEMFGERIAEVEGLLEEYKKIKASNSIAQGGISDIDIMFGLSPEGESGFYKIYIEPIGAMTAGSILTFASLESSQVEKHWEGAPVMLMSMKDLLFWQQGLYESSDYKDLNMSTVPSLWALTVKDIANGLYLTKKQEDIRMVANSGYLVKYGDGGDRKAQRQEIKTQMSYGGTIQQSMGVGVYQFARVVVDDSTPSQYDLLHNPKPETDKFPEPGKPDCKTGWDKESKEWTICKDKQEKNGYKMVDWCVLDKNADGEEEVSLYTKTIRQNAVDKFEEIVDIEKVSALGHIFFV